MIELVPARPSAHLFPVSFEGAGCDCAVVQGDFHLPFPGSFVQGGDLFSGEVFMSLFSERYLVLECRASSFRCLVTGLVHLRSYI